MASARLQPRALSLSQFEFGYRFMTVFSASSGLFTYAYRYTLEVKVHQVGFRSIACDKYGRG